MRYLAVRITDPKTGEVLIPNYSSGSFSRVAYSATTWTWSSLRDGATITQIGGTNPAALRTMIDISTGPQHLPQAGGLVRIYGVSLQQLGRSADLIHMNITIAGGMAAGYPLANPKQAGTLCSGQIWNSIACYNQGGDGMDQYLDLIVYPSGSSPSSSTITGIPGTMPIPAAVSTPANLVLDWQPGQPLLAALVPALQVAFPGYTVRGQVDASLVLTGAPSVSYFQTLKELAAFVYQKSLSIIAGSSPSKALYAGVHITLDSNVITISDLTQPTTPVVLNGLDLIGQPVRTAPFLIQATCVMRGDLDVMDYVVLPATLVQNTPGAQSQFTPQSPNALIFSGNFIVQHLRHVGDSRQLGGTSWITVIDLLNIPTTSTGSPVPRLPEIAQPKTGLPFYIPQ